MKKVVTLIIFVAVLVILIFSWPNIREKFFPEKEAEHMINEYYNSLINEDYEDAFKVLYLYDYKKNSNEFLSTGTTLPKEQAKDFFMEKIAYLKEQNYIIKDYKIKNVEYSDAHTFWHHILLKVEVNGKMKEFNEVAEIWKGKLLIGEREDPYARFRDGKMKIKIPEHS
ncbi:hypothetical protein [Sediminibacillus halophilus]|uniref:Uncharacterized protein n=1 Tax=Sediminibacillus halophilus TaxID=482461 RepID=A0A1G9RNB6_9BACI|nr:hypothetical protein [Sediminibacillus halophilus]SDM24457.1 hypothetical protein SAMN05216244_2053 [Sediminibacillus halophilus]